MAFITAALRTWKRDVESRGLDNAIPKEGVVILYLHTTFQLHVRLDAEENQLLYFNVRTALGLMLHYYENMPPRSGGVPLSEIHVLDGYFLEGSVTLTKVPCARGLRFHGNGEGSSTATS